MSTPFFASRSYAFVTEDDRASGGEDRFRKRLHKTTPDNAASNLSQAASVRAMANARSSLSQRRKSSGRDYKAPLGPRPLNTSPSKRTNSDASLVAATLSARSLLPTSTSENTLASNMRRRDTTFDCAAPSFPSTSTSEVYHSAQSPFSFDFDEPYRDQDASAPSPANSTSLMSGSLQIASRTTGGTRSSNMSLDRKKSSDFYIQAGPEARRTPTLGFQLDNPLKDSSSKPHPPLPSTAVISSASLSAVLPVRNRRQSQFPVAATTSATFRHPRKSIGPGILPAVGDKSSVGNKLKKPISNSAITGDWKLNSEISKARARVGAASTAASTNENRPPQNGNRQLRGRSFQVPVGQPQPGIISTFGDPNEFMIPIENSVGTPARQSLYRAVTPSSSTNNYVGGLGARTISPTDARRIKRMSTVTPHRATPQNPPTPDVSLSARQSVYSPPLPTPRRATPASSRETPELAKRLSASRPLSSRSSFSSLRPSSPNSQRRSSLSGSTSKPRNVHSSAAEEGEFVPPVPAIPKAFESPKDQIEQPPFPNITPVEEKSIVELQMPTEMTGNPRPPEKEPPLRRGFALGSQLDVSGNKVAAHHSSSRPTGNSRLAPLNILPLGNISTSSSRTPSSSGRSPETKNQVTPPLKRNTARTPGTPMTASRATFSNNPLSYGDMLDSLSFLRSSTSHDDPWSHAYTPEEMDREFFTKPMEFFYDSTRPSISPFVYESNSSAQDDVDALKKDETDRILANNPPSDLRSSRFASFRSQITNKVSKEPKQNPTSDSQPTAPPATATPLRRKLSVGWRRNTSKSSHMSQQTEDEPSFQLQESNYIPPPKLPASVIRNQSGQASPTRTSVATSSRSARLRKLSFHKSEAALRDEASAAKGIEENERSSLKTPSSRTTISNDTDSSPGVQMAPRQATTRSQTGDMSATSQEPRSDRDDLAAEDEMKRLGAKRRGFANAAKELDDLRKRAIPKERMSPAQASRIANLNIFERGEVIDYRDVYFCGGKNAKKFVGDLNAAAANFGFDDERGDYNLVLGDHLAYRYEVIDVLGKGSFGQVVRCIDHKAGTLVAIKIIRNKKRFHQQALVEVNILQKVRDWDPHNRHNMISFTQSFYFRGHLCISTELLGMNLYELIKAHEFRGFSLKLIRSFTKQLLGSLVLLQTRRVIHCDLKPENILLAHPLRSEIKVIDFGSSCFENEKVYTYIQSRFYRSPEVILGMSYGMSIDMWSVGCILAELLTGYPIFPGENEQEQLACIMEVFGPPEKHLIEKSTRKKLFFDSMGKPRVTVSSKGKRRRPSSKTLQQALKCEDEAFVDFISRCLRWDPERRIKPDEAMGHRFVTGVRQSTRAAVSSPAKRTTAAPATGRIRPLPEPPATIRKANAGSGSTSSQPSPTKLATPHPPRRHSVMPGTQNGVSVKRNSNGTAVGAATGLSRVAQRTASNKQDFASAAAIASLRQR